LFIHVGSALAYFLYHGAVASVAFALKRETNTEQLEVLSGMLDIAYRVAPLSLVTLLVSGVLMAFMGRWWSHGWIWTSIAAFIVIGIVMFMVGKLYVIRQFERVDNQTQDPEPEENYRILRLVLGPIMNRHYAKIPAFLTIAGLLVMSGILWLMMFKPF
jgi:uncharacterized membrane protein HdeD (DUF308 family)